MAIFKLSCLILLFLLPTTSSSYYGSAPTESQISYADHCASIVPKPTQEQFHYTRFSLPRHTGYYKGGSNLLIKNSSFGVPAVTSLIFRIWSIQAADHVEGLFKISGYIVFHRDGTYYHLRNYTHSRPTYYSGGMYYDEKQYYYSKHRGPVRFSLNGFWSESSGKLCMIGWYYSRQSHSGDSLYQPAVLKLYNFKNSTTAVNGLITGTLESLLNSENDPNFFKPVSIMILPMFNYEYSLVSKENVSGLLVQNDSSPGLPLTSFPRQTFCSLFSKAVNLFDLRFAGHCGFSAKNCTPFGREAEYLPLVVSFSEIECLEHKQRLRALIKFSSSRYDEPFNPNTALIGEGLWDSKKNQLNLVGCRFLGVTEDSFADAHVGDCSIGLSLRYPSIWTIGNSNSIVGNIWTSKNVTELGYFDKISFKRSYLNLPMRVSGLKYQYTKIDKARKLCSRKKHVNEEGAIYPYPFSQDMGFDLKLNSAKRLTVWGYSSPLSVGNELYSQFWYSKHYSNSTFAKTKQINISYQIGIRLLYGAKLSNGVSIFNMSSRSSSKVDISAEGIYDYSTGKLCLTGCRNLDLSDQLPIDIGSGDCEIRIDIQFSGRHSNYSSGFIKGSIGSTRKKSDPLHFEPLDFGSAAYETSVALESISRMDVEIVMVLISTTLACVFLGIQLFHLKRHPDVPAFISLFMLSILTVGYMIPLMLNFEALFMKSPNRQNLLLGSGGWFEANEVIVRVLTLIALLLQFRLLQFTLSARSSGGIRNESWIAEKETLFVALPLYAAGALLTMFMTWRKSNYDHVLLTSSLTSYQENRVLDALKSYAGLVLDGFLLPQILLNIFRNSRENVLSCSFYIGTTFVRLLPHAYDLYTAQTTDRYIDRSNIFVNPAADFYSTAWDVIITFGGLLFALIIFLQQKFGGRCVLTFRFKKLDVLQKVPTASET
ncbi:hypothetical protein FEM48_Zijuj12G0102400 [Ziziphus jujuba var. spinosa]|uniref:RING-type E3 ubiquitin transferase n=1 Tax=Ziziphus jujuba var. spinosa TaxID=714518 RepID=A0A978UCQ8_ZIZJJ|nr:hypothetical protein FEM48_Zijuj12G0102400 [Ziziphus jujuba var. spinosa]